MWLTPLTIVTFHKTPVWWLWFTETFRSMTCVQSTGKYKVPTYVRRISNVFFFYLCMCRERDMHRSALCRLAYDPVCMCLTRCDRIVWPPYENSITTFKPCFKNISSTPSLLGYFFFSCFFFICSTMRCYQRRRHCLTQRCRSRMWISRHTTESVRESPSAMSNRCLRWTKKKTMPLSLSLFLWAMQQRIYSSFRIVCHTYFRGNSTSGIHVESCIHFHPDTVRY